MGPIGFPETSATTNQRCITFQQNEGVVSQLPSDVMSCQLHRCGNLESRKNELSIGIVSESGTKISKRKIRNKTASITRMQGSQWLWPLGLECLKALNQQSDHSWKLVSDIPSISSVEAQTYVSHHKSYHFVTDCTCLSFRPCLSS